MSVLFICPTQRKDVPRLSEKCPLALIPLMGQTLLEYWLTHLAAGGEQNVTVLAHDQADAIRTLVGNGARWGLDIDIVTESRELTPAQALLKYGSPDNGGNGRKFIVLDHFPGFEDRPLFGSYGQFYAGVRTWIPCALTPERVGVREIEHGVFAHVSSSISPEAQLRGPCWIGSKVFVGDGAVVGPGAVLERGSFIENYADVQGSYVGPDTFVGRFAQITDSLAWGSTLIDWQSGSSAEVPDPFLLCALRRGPGYRSQSGLGRLTEMYTRNKAELLMACKHLLMKKES